MKLVTSSQARTILSIEGRPINVRTFDKLVKAGLLRLGATVVSGFGVAAGTRFFRLEDVEALAKRMPKKRLPPRFSLVDQISGVKGQKKPIRGPIR